MPVPQDADREITSELQSGEEIVWMGRPDPRQALLSGGSLAALLLGLVCMVSAIFWTAATTRQLLHPAGSGGAAAETEVAFMFFGAPLFVVGLIILSIPYWAYRIAAQTIYAITNKRFLIASGVRIRKVQSISPDSVASVRVRSRRGGAGDLIFNSAQAMAQSSNSSGARAVGFFGIEQVQDVENTIRNTFPNLAV